MEIIVTESLKKRFFAKIELIPFHSCWEWTACKDEKGYGHIGIKRSRPTKAHRVSRVIHNGSIPTGMFVCHSCDNPSCVNPNHLWLGTNKDNIIDASSKRRLREQDQTHCISGHPFSGSNLYTEPNSKRRCRICVNQRKRKHRLKLDHKKW